MTRSLLGKVWLILAAAVILVAVALSVVRILLPYAERYHDDVERWASAVLGQPVDIGSIEARWHGLGPRLTLSDVRVLDERDGRTAVRLGRAEVAFNFLSSAIRGAPRIERLLVSDVRLAVVRGPDGAVSVAGIGVAPEGKAPALGKGGERLVAWLLSQRQVALADAEITWTDLSGEETTRLQFSDVSLEARNAGRRHQVEGSAMLPDLIGRRFSFAVDMRGDVLGSRDWDGRAYVSGGGLRLDKWSAGIRLGGLRLAAGTAEVTAWAQWKRGRLQALDGELSAFDLVLSSQDEVASTPEGGTGAGKRFAADALSGRFAWRRRERGWRLDVNRFALERAERLWPFSDFAVQVESGEAGVEVTASAGYLGLADTAEFLLASDLLSARAHDLVAALRPQGAITGAQVRIERGGEGTDYALRAGFTDLTTSPHGRIPGATGFDGGLYIDRQGGSVDLDTRSAELRFSSLFREPLPVGEMHGLVQWSRGHDGGWAIHTSEITLANRDLSLNARGGLDLPAGGADGPAIDLVADFRAGTAENASLYFPAGVIPPKALSWLDRAIIAGNVPRGRLVLRGPLRAFPFDHREGEFKVDFDVRRGVLDYAPGWPRIGDIDARVVFEGRGMRIEADGGRSLSSRVSDVEVRIDNLGAKPALLTVNGKARGPTEDALRFLRETPLADKFGRYMEGAAARGDSHLDLELAIPLGQPAIDIDGTLAFQDSALSLADASVDITEINGELHFTGEGLDARVIHARILGLPSVVKISSAAEQGEPVTRIEAGGSVDAGEIPGLLDIGPLTRLSGRTRWQAGLRIPGAHAGGDATADLWIASDLTGMAVNLPAPLAKPPGQPMRLRLETVLPRSLDRPVRLTLGESLRGIFDLDQSLNLERGELRLGGGAPRLPEDTGLHITGTADRLDYASWAGLLPKGQGEERTLVNGVDLEVGELDFHGRLIHEARLSARRGEQAWITDMKSREITGRIEIPRAEGAPWRLDLEQLQLARVGNREREHLDPQELPAIHIDSKRFVYNDIDFGALSLIASRRASGLHFDRIMLSSKSARISAGGDWVATSQSQYSSFVIEFDTDNFGDALSRFGYANTIRKGKGHFDITARWTGPPTDFALERLDGSMHLLITDGRLLDVEPGPGRIFGLISLQALPRRLTLDFSDVFKKGFTFDRIEGNFIISDGVAKTSDLSMDGPAAAMSADGRINLADGTYDQKVVVTPNVSSGLPVAGAVAGGVGVGAAILLMEKLFRPDIERLTRITYRVTGNWSNPKIERLQNDNASGGAQDKKRGAPRAP